MKSKNQKYFPKDIEEKWRKVWEETGLYKQTDSQSKLDREPANNEKYYVLVELPYPSGDLHIGHWFTFVVPDVLSRFLRMNGKNVFFPIGFDAFGLPAENAAIKRGVHPKDWTMKNIETMTQQFHTMGTMIDWDSVTITCLPEYYRWNQWIFLKMYEKGLAYRGKMLSNWCPVDQTVLANEHVADGKCWRCGSIVEQKEVEQWFLRITDYAEKLLWPQSGKTKKSSEEDLVNLTDKLNGWVATLSTNITERSRTVKTGIDSPGVEPGKLGVATQPSKPAEPIPKLAYDNNEVGVNAASSVDWPLSVKAAQNEWIGKKEGMIITHQVVDMDLSFDTFTAYPVWSWADTFIVIAPEHSLIKQLIKGSANERQVLDFIAESAKITTSERNEDKFEKKGVFTGRYAKDPFGGEDMPIWVANFALLHFGTGIIRCSAHDPRDYIFAKKYGIVLKEIVERIDPAVPVNAHGNKGVLKESGPFTGREVGQVLGEVITWIEKQGIGKRHVNYHLHDWSISRQRYWGTPVPMIHCGNCGIVPVPYDQLPVELPYNVDYTPKGKAPLASNEEWLSVTCPKCQSPAQRDPETLDTFFDSSWYYYRYVSPHYEKAPFDTQAVKALMPVDVYFGGGEHTLGHTLYARFFTKFLKDIGLVDFSEFAKKRVQHGIVLGPDGNKMSKSKGNVINPDDVVKEFGTDAVRVYLSFMMPYEATGPWSADAMHGAFRFLKRVWELQFRIKSAELRSKDKEYLSSEDLYEMHRTIKKVTEDIKLIHLNTAVAALMEWLNYLSRKESVSQEEYKTFLLLLSPFAPYVTEELWQIFKEKEPTAFIPSRGGERGKGYPGSIHQQSWSLSDKNHLVAKNVAIAVQVNGRLRASFSVSQEDIKMQEKIEEIAKRHENIVKNLEGKTVKKVIYVPGKIINFVTG